MERLLEKNSQFRKDAKKNRRKVAVTAAFLIHLLILVLLTELRPLSGGPVSERFDEGRMLFEMTDFVPPSENKTDAVVKDPKAYSTKSYSSEQNTKKRGSFGAPPSSLSKPVPPPSPDRKPERAKTEDDFEENASGLYSKQPAPDTVKNFVGSLFRKQFKKIYTSAPENRRPGNDGEIEGRDAKNDFSVISPKDLYISYIQKFRNKIQNVWSPHTVLSGSFDPASDITTVLNVQIRRDGEVGNIEVSRSSGIPAFDLEAVRSVRQGGPYSAFPSSWRDKSFFTFRFGFTVVGVEPM